MRKIVREEGRKGKGRELGKKSAHNCNGRGNGKKNTSKELKEKGTR